MSKLRRSSRRGFNSRLVQLKEFGRVRDGGAGMSFNSRLVQLKGNNHALRFDRTLFQFQIGSIKRHQKIFPERVRNLFQFQIGSIKSGDPATNAYAKAFVSIPDWFN